MPVEELIKRPKQPPLRAVGETSGFAEEEPARLTHITVHPEGA